MGKSYLQRKTSDTIITPSLFASLSKLGFPSGFELVIIFLFKETKEHPVYLLSFTCLFLSASYGKGKKNVLKSYKLRLSGQRKFGVKDKGQEKGKTNQT